MRVGRRLIYIYRKRQREFNVLPKETNIEKGRLNLIRLCIRYLQSPDGKLLRTLACFFTLNPCYSTHENSSFGGHTWSRWVYCSLSNAAWDEMKKLGNATLRKRLFSSFNLKLFWVLTILFHVSPTACHVNLTSVTKIPCVSYSTNTWVIVDTIYAWSTISTRVWNTFVYI